MRMSRTSQRIGRKEPRIEGRRDPTLNGLIRNWSAGEGPKIRGDVVSVR
jgi:hypothetical protein